MSIQNDITALASMFNSREWEQEVEKLSIDERIEMLRPMARLVLKWGTADYMKAVLPTSNLFHDVLNQEEESAR